MRRVIIVILLILAGLIGAALTYREEYFSSYHFDTLREERFVTTRILGIPVLQRERKPDDPYPGAYTAITGKEPDRSHWHRMRPDYVRLPWMSAYHCFGFSFEVQQRRELLAAVYDQFRSGRLSKPMAAATLQRVEDLSPPTPGATGTGEAFKAYIANLDALRKELELKPHFAR